MKKIVINKSVTNWHIENVYRYMIDIYDIKTISKEREIELADKIKLGDESAVKELIEANLRFVITVAKQFQGQGLELDDLIAEGNSGLVVAARKFDNTKDIKFLSYAVWWIRQAIMFAIAEQTRTVKIPMNKINNIIKINRILERTESIHERDLTDNELFEAMLELVPSLTKEDFDASLNAKTKTISLDSPLENNKDYDFLVDTFENTIPDYNTNFNQELKEHKGIIENLLNTLSPVERDIIKYEFDLDFNIFRHKSEILLTYSLDDKSYDLAYKRGMAKLKKNGRVERLKDAIR